MSTSSWQFSKNEVTMIVHHPLRRRAPLMHGVFLDWIETS